MMIARILKLVEMSELPFFSFQRIYFLEFLEPKWVGILSVSCFAESIWFEESHLAIGNESRQVHFKKVSRKSGYSDLI